MGIAAAVLWAALSSVIAFAGFRAFDLYTHEPDVRFVDHFDIPLVRFDSATATWTTLGLPPEQPKAMAALDDGGALLIGAARSWRTEDGERFTSTASHQESSPATGDARAFVVPTGVYTFGNGEGSFTRDGGQVERFTFTGIGVPLLAALGDELVLDVSQRKGSGQWDAWLIDGTHVKQVGAPGPLRHRASLVSLGNGRALLGGGVWSESGPNLDGFALEIGFIAAALAFVSLCFFVLRRAHGRARAVFFAALVLGALMAWFAAGLRRGSADVVALQEPRPGGSRLVIPPG